MNFLGTSEYILSLRGKEVSIVFNSGDDIKGTLKDICPDALVLSSGEKIAICCVDKIVMISEGTWEADKHE